MTAAKASRNATITCVTSSHDAAHSSDYLANASQGHAPVRSQYKSSECVDYWTNLFLVLYSRPVILYVVSAVQCSVID